MIDFTNVKQWESIKDAVALLFYRETSDDVVFDPEGDSALLKMHTRPFSFDNKRHLATYEALTDRARYYCKPHPSGETVAAQAAAELGNVSPDDLLVFVYKRDTAASSNVKQRHRSPFRNTTNGLGVAGAPVTFLFSQYSHDPFVSARLVWHRELRMNASVGLVVMQIEQRFG